MKKIVIIGTGKAAKLHYLSYKKFLNSDILYFVDPFHKTNYNNIMVYDTLKDFLNDTNYSTDDVIIDICTPCFVFYSIIEDCKLNGFTNIIVEKPFIASQSEFESQLSGLNVCMVQNYLYSNITKTIKQIICENNLQIKDLIIDFSKNRIIDSFNNRGMYKEQTTSVFEVEFPHELYIADYLLNLNDNFKITDLKVKDMLKDGKRLKNHGYGQIVGNQNDLLTVSIKLFDFSTGKINYNKYTRYVVFRCIRNSYGNYNKFSSSEKLLLDSWYIKHKIVFIYGIKYSLLLMSCYLVFGYKKGISLYKSHFKVTNKRRDIINDIPKQII